MDLSKWKKEGGWRNNLAIAMLIVTCTIVALLMIKNSWQKHRERMEEIKTEMEETQRKLDALRAGEPWYKVMDQDGQDGRAAEATDNDPQLSKEAMIRHLVAHVFDEVNEGTLKEEILRAKETLSADLKVQLPTGFEQRFADKLVARLPEMKAHAVELYSKTYSHEEILILYVMDLKYPWIKEKGEMVMQELISFSYKVGEECGYQTAVELDLISSS